MSKKPLPKLSEELEGPKHPRRCQSCGGDETDPDVDLVMSFWIEHDDNDKPTRTIVILCHPCAKVLIEPHPRLYAEMERWHPHPGKEVICIDCKHREGIVCSQAKFNGGAGVMLAFPKPYQVHLCRVPRSKSGWHTQWSGPVSHCDRKQTLELVE